MSKLKFPTKKSMKESLTHEDFAKAEAAMIEAVPTPFVAFQSSPCEYWFTFGAPGCAPSITCKQEQEGKIPMNTNSERCSQSNSERDYLNRRLNETSNSLDRDLQKQFHIGESNEPTSYKELIDWIKNDKFTLDAKRTKRIDVCIEEEDVYYGTSFDGIIWTGRGWTVDREGYSTARGALMKALTAAKDIVNAGDAAAGLKALQDFQSWTYTAPVAA